MVHKIKAELNITEGKIEKIAITIDKNKNIEGQISINQINIGEKKERNDITQEEQNKIKQKISENYGVENKNITVNSLWSGGKLYV